MTTRTLHFGDRASILDEGRGHLSCTGLSDNVALGIEPLNDKSLASHWTLIRDSVRSSLSRMLGPQRWRPDPPRRCS